MPRIKIYRSVKKKKFICNSRSFNFFFTINRKKNIVAIKNRERKSMNFDLFT